MDWPTVLIVTGGMTPQVVTEAVFALAKRLDDPCIPIRVVCVATQGVAKRFEEELDCALLRLSQEWDIEPRWGSPVVAVPASADDVPIADVRTYMEGVIYGDFINNLVREETLDEASRVHLSIVGGRKTMSYHGGAAINMWGRPQDELSHVLVGVSEEAKARDPTLEPEDFEHSREFWFPTRASTIITGRGGKRVDARDATIQIPDIPFVPLRDLLPKNLTISRISHQKLVTQLRATIQERLVLRLTLSTQRVKLGDLADFRLEAIHFALYRLMAEWAHDQVEGAGPAGIGPGHRGWLTHHMLRTPQMWGSRNPVQRFIDYYLALGGTADVKNSVSPNPANQKQQAGNVQYFSERLSTLRDGIANHIPNRALQSRIGGHPLPPRPKGRFGLALTPAEIIIDH